MIPGMTTEYKPWAGGNFANTEYDKEEGNKMAVTVKAAIKSFQNVRTV
jgi:hypothetical protein